MRQYPLTNKEEIKTSFDVIASSRDAWKRKNWYYHYEMGKLMQSLVPRGSSVLELGCATGDLIASLKPKKGTGVDISEKMIECAKRKYPHYSFYPMDAESLTLNETYRYVILSDVIGFLSDIQKMSGNLHQVTSPRSRIIITSYNYLWESLVEIAQFLGLKMPEPARNWVSRLDVENFLYLAGFEVIRKGHHILFPFYIPFLSGFINRYVAKLPFINRLSLVYYVIARPNPIALKAPVSVSVIVPAKNEAGNIESLARRMPKMGSSTEIIFVEGHSKDHTLRKVKEVKNKYPLLDIKICVQGGVGKGDAVRKGFNLAKGEIAMILDADMTVAPEELPKFYQALVEGKGEFINGSRLTYPLQKQSMRFLNVLGNKFFSLLFSWLLDQRMKDTLCGTKVLWKEDYEKIKNQRKFFGDFDPFGDFDLLFGAAKLNLKIVDLPIHYHERTYGVTNIKRFSHGWLLLKMCLFAMRKIKFI